MDTAVMDNSVSKEQWFGMPPCVITETKKKSFNEACVECNAVPLEAFIGELKERVKKRYRNEKS